MTQQVKVLLEPYNLVTVLLFPLIAWLLNAKNLIVFVIVFTFLILIMRMENKSIVIISFIAMVMYPFFS